MSKSLAFCSEGIAPGKDAPKNDLIGLTYAVLTLTSFLFWVISIAVQNKTLIDKKFIETGGFMEDMLC
ncbi:MAG: hypothetical protein WCX28_12850 [Bacteriovoracaceae bacterium]|nr:hypothetical protein [Bacteroidota bacterium]